MAVGVRLALVAAAPSTVELFLPEIPGRSHNQLLDDLAGQLRGEARFVPVRTASRVRLIGKQAIAWISVPRYAPAAVRAEAPVEPPVEISDDEASPDAVVELAPEPTADIPEELTLFDHQHFVEIELAHGSKLIGTLLDSESADFSRLGDHLNRSGSWLRLWTPDQHYLINAGQVVAVTELGEVW